MKILSLMIVILIALIAFGHSLSRKQTSGVTPAVRDVRETQPFHGSDVGKHSSRCLRRLPLEPDELTLVWSCRSHDGSRATSTKVNSR